jgi:hypothetical protein
MANVVFHNNTVSINDVWYESHAHLLRMTALELGAGPDKIEELLEKFLSKKLKLKQQKNPHAPKKPKSSYFYYCDQFRPELISNFKNKNPNAKIQIALIAKELGQKWKKLTDNQKQKYIKMANKDKVRYESEMNVFTEKFG